MYNELVEALRLCVKYGKAEDALVNAQKAADAIEGLNKRIDFLLNCIYEAEDALDRGADNDWAMAALEKAQRDDGDV